MTATGTVTIRHRADDTEQCRICTESDNSDSARMGRKVKKSRKKTTGCNTVNAGAGARRESSDFLAPRQASLLCRSARGAGYHCSTDTSDLVRSVCGPTYMYTFILHRP